MLRRDSDPGQSSLMKGMDARRLADRLRETDPRKEDLRRSPRLRALANDRGLGRTVLGPWAIPRCEDWPGSPGQSELGGTIQPALQ